MDKFFKRVNDMIEKSERQNRLDAEARAQRTGKTVAEVMQQDQIFAVMLVVIMILVLVAVVVGVVRITTMDDIHIREMVLPEGCVDWRYAHHNSHGDLYWCKIVDGDNVRWQTFRPEIKEVKDK